MNPLSATMTAVPEYLTDRPKLWVGEAMDALSDVLLSIRLRGAIFLDAHFTAPWCVSSTIVAEDCKPLVEKPAQLIAYHVIIGGRLLLGIEGEREIELHAGEIVLLPRNDAHTLA